MGTWVPGRGLRARQKSRDARIGAATSTIGFGTAASKTAGTRFGDEGVESGWADAAQQLSACAWLTPADESEPDAAFLCIGQALPSTQQAMRASALVCQPAHSTQPPPPTASSAANAIARLKNAFTLCRMRFPLWRVNPWVSPAERMRHPKLGSRGKNNHEADQNADDSNPVPPTTASVARGAAFRPAPT